MIWSTGYFLEQPTRARHEEAEVDVVDKQDVLGYGGLFRGEDRVGCIPLMYVVTVSSNALQIICVYDESQESVYEPHASRPLCVPRIADRIGDYVRDPLCAPKETTKGT
jgi:hypothetical protein